MAEIRLSGVSLLPYKQFRDTIIITSDAGSSPSLAAHRGRAIQTDLPKRRCQRETQKRALLFVTTTTSIIAGDEERGGHIVQTQARRKRRGRWECEATGNVQRSVGR